MVEFYFVRTLGISIGSSMLWNVKRLTHERIRDRKCPVSGMDIGEFEIVLEHDYEE